MAVGPPRPVGQVGSRRQLQHRTDAAHTERPLRDVADEQGGREVRERKTVRAEEHHLHEVSAVFHTGVPGRSPFQVKRLRFKERPHR